VKTLDDFRRVAEVMSPLLRVEALKLLAAEIARRDPKATATELCQEVTNAVAQVSLERIFDTTARDPRASAGELKPVLSLPAPSFTPEGAAPHPIPWGGALLPQVPA
jgi:hypothetical protein